MNLTSHLSVAGFVALAFAGAIASRGDTLQVIAFTLLAVAFAWIWVLAWAHLKLHNWLCDLTEEWINSRDKLRSEQRLDRLSICELEERVRNLVGGER